MEEGKKCGLIGQKKIKGNLLLLEKIVVHAN